MKKPTLRFRQVFEHPTHFKVVKPLGNPLLIAKKGLSPKTQARLRAFAQGGEVRGYDNGGDVTDMAPYVEADAQQAADADLASRMRAISASLSGLSEPSLTSPASTGIRREAPITVEAQVPATAEVAQSKSTFIPYSDPYAAIVSTFPRVSPAPIAIPAPVVVAPAEQPAAPSVAVAPVPAATPAPAPVTAPARPMTMVEIGKLPAAERPAAVRAAIEARSAPRVEAAPAVEPEAVAAEAAPAEPVKQDVLGSLAAELPKLYAAFDVADQQYEEKRKQIAADEMRDVQRKVDSARSVRDSAWNDYRNAAANEKPYMASLSTLSKIGTAVSLAAGAFASGMTGMPNYALQIFNQASADDLARQKENKNSLYNRFVAAGADVKEAEDLVQAFQIKAFASKLEDAARATTNAKAKIELQQNAIKLYGEARKREAEADAETAKAEYDRARAKSEPERLKLDQDKVFNDEIKMLADIVNDKSRNANDRERAAAAMISAYANRSRAASYAAAEARKAREPTEATGDKVDIGGELVVPLAGKTGIGKVQDELAGRNTGTRQALALSELFKREGDNIWKLDNPARDEAIARVNTLIENYSKAVGFKRAISLNAARKIEAALRNPEGFLSAVRALVGNRPPSTAIDIVYDEIKNDRDDYLTQKLGSKVYTPELRKKLYDEDRASLPPQTVKLGGP